MSEFKKFLEAIKNNDFQTLTYLWEDKELLNMQDENGDTLLHHTLKLKNIIIIQMFIGFGADLNIKNNNGITALDLLKELNNPIINAIVNSIDYEEKDYEEDYIIDCNNIYKPENKEELMELDDIKFITDFLKCDYEIIEGGLEDDTKIMECYKEHLEKGKKEGYTPLIIVPSDVLSEAIECFLEDNNAEIEDSKKLINEYIEKSKEVNYKDYLHQNIEDIYDDKEYIEEIKKSFNAPIVEGFEVFDSFGSYYDYSLDNPVTVDLILAKIPTTNPYELACYIPMGGFNDCPNPETQTAIFKYWYEKYNAYPAVVGYDTWELWVEKQPKTEEESRELAIEHYYFCLDRVDQYSENYDHGKLAATLLKSNVWYFWWD